MTNGHQLVCRMQTDNMGSNEWNQYEKRTRIDFAMWWQNLRHEKPPQGTEVSTHFLNHREVLTCSFIDSRQLCRECSGAIVNVGARTHRSVPSTWEGNFPQQEVSRTLQLKIVPLVGGSVCVPPGGRFSKRRAAALLSAFQPPVSWHWTRIVLSDLNRTYLGFPATWAGRSWENQGVAREKGKGNVWKQSWVLPIPYFPEGRNDTDLQLLAPALVLSLALLVAVSVSLSAPRPPAGLCLCFLGNYYQSSSHTCLLSHLSLNKPICLAGLKNK